MGVKNESQLVKLVPLVEVVSTRSFPSRHGPDFHPPRSQISIFGPDFHLRQSQKCLLGYLMDPCKKQTETEVNLLVNTLTPCEDTERANSSLVIEYLENIFCTMLTNFYQLRPIFQLWPIFC